MIWTWPEGRADAEASARGRRTTGDIVVLGLVRSMGEMRCWVGLGSERRTLGYILGVRHFTPSAARCMLYSVLETPLADDMHNGNVLRPLSRFLIGRWVCFGLSDTLGQDAETLGNRPFPCSCHRRFGPDHTRGHRWLRGSLSCAASLRLSFSCIRRSPPRSPQPEAAQVPLHDAGACS